MHCRTRSNTRTFILIRSDTQSLMCVESFPRDITTVKIKKGFVFARGGGQRSNHLCLPSQWPAKSKPLSRELVTRKNEEEPNESGYYLILGCDSPVHKVGWAVSNKKCYFDTIASAAMYFTSKQCFIAWENHKVVFIPKHGRVLYWNAKSYRPIGLSLFQLDRLYTHLYIVSFEGITSTGYCQPWG